ncbi:MAG: hypothetical protein PQ964_06620 [Methanobacteriaceae archaeon]|jgi:hypothetical protein
MKAKIWKPTVLLVVLFLALGAYMAFFATPQAVASLTLQANPAVTLTLCEKNTVITAEGLDAQGEALLTRLNVTGKEVQEALSIIAGALHEDGLLGPNQQVSVALHTIEGRLTQPELNTLSGNARQALLGYMTEHGLPVEVKVAVVSAKELGIDPALFKEELGTIVAALVDMEEAGIVRADALAILREAFIADPELEELTTITAAMIDLHEVGATQEDIMALFKLVKEQITAGRVDRALLLEEFTTITAAKIDMLEAGIPAAASLATLQRAMVADPKLEELTTITAAMIDLTEAGLSPEEALAKIHAAIKADPTLQNFGDQIEADVAGNGRNAENGRNENGRNENGRNENGRNENGRNENGRNENGRNAENGEDGTDEES